MNTLKKARQRFTFVLAVLTVVNVLLIAYLFWPGSSQSGKRAREQQLQEQIKTLTSEVAPLRGIDQQLTQTRVDVKTMYEQKIPSEFSQISQHLEKLLREAGVTTQGIHYSQEKNDRPEKNDLPDVQPIHIDTTVTGEYAKIARFINAVEQDKFLFIIDQISLSSSESSGVVSLQIKFETFLKAT